MGEAIRNTAILVFIRSSNEEASKKQFYAHAGYQGNLGIVHLFNRRVIQVARSSQLPTFIISGQDQVGDTFGARFSNAIQTVFDYGYKQVIALGNDCPGLNKQHLTAAAAQLERQQAIIGPATDGGAYLIGLKRDQFNKEAFAELPWQQATLSSALYNYLQAQDYPVYWLAEEQDIDDKKAFRFALQNIIGSSLKLQLLTLLGLLQLQSWAILLLRRSADPVFSNPLRGPPSNKSQR